MDGNELQIFMGLKELHNVSLLPPHPFDFNARKKKQHVAQRAKPLLL